MATSISRDNQTTDTPRRSTRALAATLAIPVAVIMTIIANAIPNALQLNGTTTGAISANYPTMITPAGYAFSIWSLIYAGLIGFAVYQSRSARRDDPVIAAITPWFLLSCACNVGWIFAWQYGRIGLSVALMAWLLMSLLMVYTRLDELRAKASRGQRAWLLAPFGLYVGWVSVAAVVNVSVFLTSIGWSGAGLSAVMWSAIMMTVATVIGLAVAWPRRDVALLGAVTWALVAIGVKYSAAPMVEGTAWTLAGIMSVAIVSALGRGRLRTAHDAQRVDA